MFNGIAEHEGRSPDIVFTKLFIFSWFFFYFFFIFI